MSEFTPTTQALLSVARGVPLIAVLLLFALPALADELPEVSAHIPWTVSERNDDPVEGYVLYRRAQINSSFDAYRLEAVIDAPPSLVAAAARRNMDDPKVAPESTKKQLLRREGEVAWFYSYIDLPVVVSDRDVITRSEHSFDPTSGVYRLDWRASDEGPPPKRGVVRLQRASGSWVFSPLPNGDTHAVYENHTDIGGSLPAWIVNPMMDTTVTRSIVDLRRSVREQHRQTAASTTASPALP